MQLERPAQRVVSTMPSTTEMLYAMGAWSQVVGVSMYCDTPAEARTLPDIGTGMQPDLERLLALEPDLVVGTVAQLGYEFIGPLEQAGISVLLVPDRNLDEVYEGTVALGRAVGREAEAQEVAAGMRRELSALNDALEGHELVTALVVYDHDPIYAAGPSTMVSQLLTAAGAVNVLTEGDWVQLDREQVIQLAPAVIFETGVRAQAELESIWGPLTTVPAVRDGRIYALEHHALYRPGPCAPEAAWLMAERLFPERVRAARP